MENWNVKDVTVVAHQRMTSEQIGNTYGAVSISASDVQPRGAHSLGQAGRAAKSMESLSAENGIAGVSAMNE